MVFFSVKVNRIVGDIVLVNLVRMFLCLNVLFGRLNILHSFSFSLKKKTATYTQPNTHRATRIVEIKWCYARNPEIQLRNKILATCVLQKMLHQANIQ